MYFYQLIARIALNLQLLKSLDKVQYPGAVDLHNIRFAVHSSQHNGPVLVRNFRGWLLSVDILEVRRRGFLFCMCVCMVVYEWVK